MGLSSAEQSRDTEYTGFLSRIWTPEITCLYNYIAYTAYMAVMAALGHSQRERDQN